jgi:cephalosporin hydroxylase
MSGVSGVTEYKGVRAMQHQDVFAVFEKFLEDIKPARILEIGTSVGGFTLFLRDTLNALGLESTTIRTYDIQDLPSYTDLRNNNIEVYVKNVFENETILQENVQEYIQASGTTLVLCDGNFKAREFDVLSPFLKTGDYIMAHDYVDTWGNYITNYNEKIWNWCEIKDTDIMQACETHNLVPYNKENFDKVVWVCRKKV